MIAAALLAPVVRLFKAPIACGDEAFAAGKSFEALRYWRKASEAGDARADYLIGALFEDGQGVLRDVVEAAAWFRRAADRGHAGAHVRLARILLHGGHNGSERLFARSDQDASVVADNHALLFPSGAHLDTDCEAAIRLLTAAVEQGEAEAGAMLGALYFEGRKAPRDIAAARSCYEWAAERGDCNAQFGLGDIHYNGLGVEKNLELGADWYEKAASNGHTRAQLALATVLYYGVGRPRDAARCRRMVRQGRRPGRTPRVADGGQSASLG